MFKLTALAYAASLVSVQAYPISSPVMTKGKVDLTKRGIQFAAGGIFPSEFVGSGFRHVKVSPDLAFSAGCGFNVPGMHVCGAIADQPCIPAPPQDCEQPTMECPPESTPECPPEPTVDCPEPTPECPPEPTPECPPQPTVDYPEPTPESPPEPTTECPPETTMECPPESTPECPPEPTVDCPEPTPECPLEPTVDCPEPTVDCPELTPECPEPTPECPPEPTPECPPETTTDCPPASNAVPCDKVQGQVCGNDGPVSFNFDHSQKNNFDVASVKDTTLYFNQKEAKGASNSDKSNTQLSYSKH
ncbi:hypothetical protein IW152_000792 [Coemansia sp. BCRC 34962]|nr:hypothetical protein IW152_000792 [Coemansia sp. BCRC 34962]